MPVLSPQKKRINSGMKEYSGLMLPLHYRELYFIMSAKDIASEAVKGKDVLAHLIFPVLTIQTVIHTQNTAQKITQEF
jgi:hypothetical protein